MRTMVKSAFGILTCLATFACGANAIDSGAAPIHPAAITPATSSSAAPTASSAAPASDSPARAQALAQMQDPRVQQAVQAAKANPNDPCAKEVTALEAACDALGNADPVNDPAGFDTAISNFNKALNDLISCQVQAALDAAGVAAP